MNSIARKQLILVAFCVASLGAVGLAGNAAVQDKLKREVQVALDDVTIGEALKQIGERAGITIELSDEAICELPEGAETRLSVSLEGRLDQSLEEMLNAFFMRYAVGSDAVVIYPRPELKHIMGRPTPETLKLLGDIYTDGIKINVIGPSEKIESLARTWIESMVEQHIVISPADMMRSVAEVMCEMAQGSHRDVPLSVALVLDEVVNSVSRGDDRWVVCAPEWPNQTAQIKIISPSEYSKIMRERLIDISFDEVTGGTILKTLAAIPDIDLTFADDDRTWLDRPISIEALNVTADEALKRVVAALGGEFRSIHVGVDGVHYSVGRKLPVPTATPETSPSTPAQSQSVPAGDAYVGKISIPMDGGKYFLEFMLRESDLTEELRQLRAERIQQILRAASNPPETAATP